MYRLASVIIPPDSRHRKDIALNHPPKIYVIVKKNGEQIGETSAAIRGWEVEFPRNDKHTYRIDSDRTATYSLELWDDQWTNELILSITELEFDSFDGPIHERQGIYDPPELATVIKFVRSE